MDVKIVLKNGDKIDVEMQNIFFSHYPKRSLYYWAQLFLENFSTGYEYSRLNKCISINILNAPFPLTDLLHSEYKILEVKKHTLLDDVFEMHFFDLTKLTEDNMMHTMSEIEQWLLFIKTRNDAIRQGLAKDNPIIAKANEALKNFYLTEEDKRAYLIANNARSDWASIRGDGKKESLQEGIEQGMKQDSYNTKLETAKRLLEMGLSIPDIMRVAMLTEKK